MRKKVILENQNDDTFSIHGTDYKALLTVLGKPKMISCK